MTNDSWTNVVDVGARLSAYETFSKTFIPPEQNNLQNVFTPYKLCEAIVAKLGESEKELKERMFLCLNMEFVEALLHCGVPAEYIWFLTDCPHKAQWARKDAYAGTYSGVRADKGLNVLLANDMLEFMEQLRRTNVISFNIVIGNPPYQTKSDESFKKTQTIWEKFVVLCCALTKEDGYTVLVHPAGWRNPEGHFEEASNSICAKQIEYLEIHDVADGLKTFGAATRYDWYVRKNCEITKETEIKGQNGSPERLMLSDVPFIPNGEFEAVFSLLSKNDKISFLWNCTYHTQARAKDGTISKKKIEEFKYPCIQNVNTQHVPSCVWYSNTNQRGHFGIPKVIFGRKCSGIFFDATGEYGMCQDCAGITGENLDKVCAAMKTQKFIDLMKMCDVGGTGDRYPRKVIALLRRDFWREFVNEDGTEK